MKNEIIVYKTNELSTHLEVIIENDSVWLTQAQMAELFKTSRNNITLHISNIFKENELEKFSVSKDFLLTAKDGKTYKTKLYNLDIIISVGYRVKSIMGTQFRIWANKILKDYLLKGSAINRIEKLESDMYIVNRKLNEIDLKICSNLTPKQGVFFNGQVFDAYIFVSELIKNAQNSIVLIDNYIDESVFLMLSKRKENVKATIFTSKLSNENILDLKKYNEQYPYIEIKIFTKSHDRFLIIDTNEIYHIGASLKDLGKKWFAFSKINFDVFEIIKRLGISNVK